jgi:hypothetical protein
MTQLIGFTAKWMTTASGGRANSSLHLTKCCCIGGWFQWPEGRVWSWRRCKEDNNCYSHQPSPQGRFSTTWTAVPPAPTRATSALQSPSAQEAPWSMSALTTPLQPPSEPRSCQTVSAWLVSTPSVLWTRILPCARRASRVSSAQVTNYVFRVR